MSAITQADIDKSSTMISLLTICEATARFLDDVGEKEITKVTSALAQSLEYIQALALDNLIVLERAMMREEQK